MEKWFKVSRYAYRDSQFIESVNVTRSTDKTVWVENKLRRKGEDKNNIHSESENYFKTFLDAKLFALKRQEERIFHIEEELRRAQSDLLKIKNQN